ncbi:hypothetical protein [Thermoactinomyces mirandus]|uniref:hypothetical protein n=1 Tax=Thermoactinomyces mirandus TaxID=2756294 RepID=UPI0015EEC952|nr:hypothetical protein [Thermoactinomyces mirandus]
MRILGGGNDHGVLIGLIPHENEPLGALVFNDSFCNMVQGFEDQISFALNLDIPQKKYRFPIPIDFKNFFFQYHLSPIENQLEFSYTEDPETDVEKRAFQFYKISRNKELIILLHNDPVRNFFYVYANEDNEELNNTIKRVNNSILNTNLTLGEAEYTAKLNDYIYQYFRLCKIESLKNSRESCGIFFREKGLKIITIEIPMFAWELVSTKTRANLHNLYLYSVANNLAPAERSSLVSEKKMNIPYIPMIDLNKLTSGLNDIVYSIMKMWRKDL